MMVIIVTILYCFREDQLAQLTSSCPNATATGARARAQAQAEAQDQAQASHYYYFK